jgi:DNA-binding NarL/FixJ family response regulator
MSVDITLVIADDHPIVRRGMADLLTGETDLKILTQLANGADALKSIRELKPTVAVLDVEMPGMNGLDVARAIRDNVAQTAVVLLTMYREEHVFNAAVDAGVRGYILKENAETELLACIRSVAKGDTFFSPSLSHLLLNRASATARLKKEKPGLNSLTPTERRILKMISEDKTSKEIADALGISPRTVDNHRSNMGEKLELRGSHSLLKFAYDNKGLL